MTKETKFLAETSVDENLFFDTEIIDQPFLVYDYHKNSSPFGWSSAIYDYSW